VRSVVGSLFPLSCAACRAPSESPLCASCARALRRARPLRPPSGIDAWNEAFAYAEPLRSLIAAAKFRRAHALLEWLADALVETLPSCARVCDVATWIPTTRRRRRSRGYDQAEVLARALARRLELPCARLLTRRSPPQAGRSRAERVRTPCFACTRSLPAVSVLVVDDVTTTGATFRGAAVALRSAGVQQVLAAVAARTL